MATTIHPGFAFWSSWGEEWQVLVLVGARIRNLNECLLHPCLVLARIWFSWRGPKKKAHGESAPYGGRGQSHVLGRELLTRRAALGLVPFQTLRQEYPSRVRRFLDLETMPQEPTGGSRLV